MNDHPLDLASFLKLVIEALEAAGVEYLIGGAVWKEMLDSIS